MLNKILLYIYFRLKNKAQRNLIVNHKFRYNLDRFLFYLLGLNAQSSQKKIEENSKLKIGFIGAFSGLLSFPKQLFINYPQSKISLYMYDEGYKNIYVESYSKFSNYRKLQHIDSHSDLKSCKSIANIIEHDQLDVLVIINRDKPYYSFISLLVSNANMVSINTGSHLLYNDFVQIQSLVQFAFGYSVNNNKSLIEINSGKKIGTFRCYPELFFFDKDTTTEESNKKIIEKNMIFIGSFYKLAHLKFLNMCAEILKSNPSFNLFFYGKGDSEVLKKILGFFDSKGVLIQVKYRGSYSKKLDPDGNIIDEKYEQALNDIKKSSVFINSFPYGGASATIEAFMMKIPVITLVSNNSSLSSYSLPSITPQVATAKAVDEYIEKCIKLLNGDETLRNRIIKEQNAILKEMTSPNRFWEKLLEVVDDNFVEKRAN